MGFTGNLTVARLDAPLDGTAAVRAAGGVADRSAAAEGWQLLASSGDDLKPSALARETGGPVLNAFVFDSDFAVVEVFDTGRPAWTCVLSPEAALDHDCPQDWLGDPAETAATAADWAAAHGLAADREALAAVLTAESDPFAEELVLVLLAALGLPAALLAAAG
ncbi:hypothetical protein [Kitasatospora sp. DSM 101779]|uniref:hypothetical protein n=1 Tax=Kitasatospora sp. DSM 101779 TaxID=2853165 RepID=UPI0021DA99E7|nr:hypothetical protein [Kitasatospora sp. DSM 101779]MCU7826044.1 hypothetical protein [Kitasatospora sp. DSM 101779]